jgi:hypothetical protein
MKPDIIIRGYINYLPDMDLDELYDHLTDMATDNHKMTWVDSDSGPAIVWYRSADVNFQGEYTRAEIRAAYEKHLYRFQH